MKVYPRQSPNTDRSDFTAVFNAIKRGKIFNGELIRDFEKNISLRIRSTPLSTPNCKK